MPPIFASWAHESNRDLILSHISSPFPPRLALEKLRQALVQWGLLAVEEAVGSSGHQGGPALSQLVSCSEECIYPIATRKIAKDLHEAINDFLLSGVLPSSPRNIPGNFFAHPL